jgi:hypothetical protein
MKRWTESLAPKAAMDVWQVEDGLPDNRVIAIQQTPDRD